MPATLVGFHLAEPTRHQFRDLCVDLMSILLGGLWNGLRRRPLPADEVDYLGITGVAQAKISRGFAQV